MINQSQSLKESFLDRIHDIGRELAHFPWGQESAYACWLAQTYYFVAHTSTFLSLSAAKFGPRNSVSLAQVLGHLREESGHERLLLNDLKALKRDLKDFPEILETSLFYQSQYYWINQIHPQAHCGYSLLLEGIAAEFGAKAYSEISQKYGESAASFIKIHNGLDTMHFEHGLNQVLSEPQEIKDSILQNLEQSAFLYRRIIEKAQAAQPINLKKSA